MPDVPENYSSLREAVNRILGQPAGGAGTQQSGFELAPKSSFSSDLGNIATTATATNTPFDPYAEQNAADAAALASSKAANDALAAQVAPKTVTTAPVVAAAPEWQSPAQKARASSPAAMFQKTPHVSPGKGMTSGEYIASKLGGYDWRGKTNEVGRLQAEYRGGPNSSVNAYIASKLGGYDWRGKASQVGMLADEYRGGPMSSANAYIASKLGGYDWRGKAADVSRLEKEYKALNRAPKK